MTVSQQLLDYFLKGVAKTSGTVLVIGVVSGVWFAFSNNFLKVKKSKKKKDTATEPGNSQENQSTPEAEEDNIELEMKNMIENEINSFNNEEVEHDEHKYKRMFDRFY